MRLFSSQKGFNPLKKSSNITSELKSHIPARRSLTGFTVVEFLIALALSTGIILALTQFVGIISNVQRFLGQKLPVEGDVEQALHVMVTDIRSMTQANSGAYPIISASSSEFVFYSDIDRDSLVERVKYRIASSSLERLFIKPTGNPLQYVTSSEVFTIPVPNLIMGGSQFLYFDENYTGTQLPLTPTSSVTSIRVVQIRLIADISTSTAPQATEYMTAVTIRNLKSN